MAYRSDLDALIHRHAALETEVGERTRELDNTRRLLEEAQQRARLPVLDNIRVASPCTADWAQMTGDDRARACAQCNKNVYNISALTRDEAEALIVKHEGKLCVRYFKRGDGTIMLKDCAVGAKRKRRRRWIIAGAVVTFAGSLIAYKAHEKANEREEVRMEALDVEANEVIMGKFETAHVEPATPVLPEQEMWVQGGIAIDPTAAMDIPIQPPVHAK
ncbi:MAG: hypothetical protein JWO36_6733 [Myxococcales bacterium]|nr:hypothetical protein [Myxococcales bacterium]